MLEPLHQETGKRPDSSTQCASWWRPLTPAAVPGQIVIAYIHTHPIVAGDHVPCNSTHVTNGNPAPSDSDLITRSRVNNLPDYRAAHWAPDWYVMSMDGVFKMDDTNSPRSQHSITDWYHGLCAW